MTEAGKAGDPLAQEFFVGEYSLNHFIGEGVWAHMQVIHLFAHCSQYRLYKFFYFYCSCLGTYDKTFVAIIDGITMGGVSYVVSNHLFKI